MMILTYSTLPNLSLNVLIHSINVSCHSNLILSKLTKLSLPISLCRVSFNGCLLHSFSPFSPASRDSTQNSLLFLFFVNDLLSFLICCVFAELCNLDRFSGNKLTLQYANRTWPSIATYIHIPTVCPSLTAKKI